MDTFVFDRLTEGTIHQLIARPAENTHHAPLLIVNCQGFAILPLNLDHKVLLCWLVCWLMDESLTSQVAEAGSSLGLEMNSFVLSSGFLALSFVLLPC